PLGYEPSELPNCSTPRCCFPTLARSADNAKSIPPRGARLRGPAVAWGAAPHATAAGPAGGLLAPSSVSGCRLGAVQRLLQPFVGLAVGREVALPQRGLAVL